MTGTMVGTSGDVNKVIVDSEITESLNTTDGKYSLYFSFILLPVAV